MKSLKYLLGIVIVIVVAVFVALFSSSTNRSDWPIKHRVQSPDKNIYAEVRCFADGGTTVGYYCALYFVDRGASSEEMMWVRTDDIDVHWLSINTLEAKVDKGSKIYDFNSHYWSQVDQMEYVILLKYK